MQKHKNTKQPEEAEKSSEDLIPKAPPKLAAQGIKTFTVARQQDETGVSGTGGFRSSWWRSPAKEPKECSVSFAG